MRTVWDQIWANAAEYRKSKGFVPVQWEEAAPRISCVAAEIYEIELALQHWSKWEHVESTAGRPTSDRETCSAACDVRREIADVVIYILGLQSDLGYNLGTSRHVYGQAALKFATPADLTHPLRREWNQAFRYWRNDDRKDFGLSMEILLVATVQLRRNLFVEDEYLSYLLNDCNEKIAYMHNRRHLHGGKDPRT